MIQQEEFLQITPEEFEKKAISWLDRTSLGKIKQTIFHRKRVKGASGEYEIDILVELQLYEGIRIRILIECKRYRNPIKREIVMALESKLRDIGAHKGIVVSTSDFQSGAVKFAKTHGIALVKIAGDETQYILKAVGAPRPPRTGFVGWFMTLQNNDDIIMELIDEHEVDGLKQIEQWLQEN